MTWPRKTQEPWVEVSTLVFLPNQPTPARWAAALSSIGPSSTYQRALMCRPMTLGEAADVELEAFFHQLVVVVAPGVAGDAAFEVAGFAVGGEVVAEGDGDDAAGAG